MPRKKITIPLEQQIDIKRKELEQNQNHLNQLLEAKKEKDRRERTHRLCERAGFMESILPDTLKLTKEKFESFLNKALLNDNVTQILRGLIENDGETVDNTITTPDNNASEIEGSLSETKTAEISVETIEPKTNIIIYTGWQINGGKVVANQHENCLQVFFDSKPNDDTRGELKSNGFSWSQNAKAWYRELNNDAIDIADSMQCIQPITGEKPTELQKAVQASV
jgi:sugar-specific transcriptional regulator TrmB